MIFIVHKHLPLVLINYSNYHWVYVLKYLLSIMARSVTEVVYVLSIVLLHKLVFDSNYCGELAVSLVNDSDDAYTIKKGDRIAQIILLPTPDSTIATSSNLITTQRNTGGFGSTDAPSILKPIPNENIPSSTTSIKFY